MKYSRSMPEAEQPPHNERDPLYGEKWHHAGECHDVEAPPILRIIRHFWTLNLT